MRRKTKNGLGRNVNGAVFVFRMYRNNFSIQNLEVEFETMRNSSAVGMLR